MRYFLEKFYVLGAPEHCPFLGSMGGSHQKGKVSKVGAKPGSLRQRFRHGDSDSSEQPKIRGLCGKGVVWEILSRGSK